MRPFIYFFSLFLLFSACQGAGEQNNLSTEDVGLNVYTKNCQLCHGKDGKLNAMKAKDLSISILSPELTEQAIVNGSPANGMPAYGPRLSAEALKALLAYVLTLRK
jgi:mono/diheme cytochrome c family protein